MTVNANQTERVRVNVRSLANMAGMRTEKRNGRDVIIVPSATMPDDVVMNRVFYPADETERSYKQLERKPAPLGHPMVNGQFVSALDPEGINIAWCGAWNENVRRENGRVFLDKVIDVARANQCEGGKSVLKAIENGGPIHTSNALFCTLEAVEDNEDYDYIARNFQFDHDAILINEEGAATPEQGVGMLVNAQGQTEQVRVINSSLMADIERDLGWAVESAVRALERRERLSVTEQIISAIKAIFDGRDSRETSSNNGDETMADKAQFEELSAKVNALTEASEKIGETIANAVAAAVKPLVDALAEMKANQEAKIKEERGLLIEQVVNAKIEGLDKDTIEKMDTVALNALLSISKQKKPAAPLTSGFAINLNSGEQDFSPLAAIKGAN